MSTSAGGRRWPRWATWIAGVAVLLVYADAWVVVPDYIGFPAAGVVACVVMGVGPWRRGGAA